ncbi:MAG: regulatory protein RecX [Candidatus Fermentibacteraceae bacterium]|nr:regulatory protein RecX [Candidatus Fermentibacteraceae bacterium]
MCVTMPSGIYIVPASGSPEKGSTVDPEMLSDLQNSCARDDVQLFLAHSERSSGQLRKKVLSLSYSGTVADSTVAWAEEYGFVDDNRFCTMFIASRTMGLAGLKMELARRGVPEAAVETALAPISETDNIQDLVRQVSKKYGHLENRETARRRALAWLSRRGFSGETIHRVLKEAL